MDEPADPEADRPPPRDDPAFLGHPRGLATLSGPEVWERFSFLGMQAVLVLHFADTVADGGLGMAPGTAASVSAAYGTMVYLVSVAGGWLADRILGSYRAVLWGGILIACGHYAMAVPTATTTWVGHGLISAGTGLLKPNVATMVGRLHRTDDDRRDAGFALHYMAINIGAFAGPLVTGRLGEHKGRRRGFSAAAVGMTAGLVQYVPGRRHLAGRKHSAEYALAPDAMRRAVWRIVGGCLASAALATLPAVVGWLTTGRFVDLLTLVSVIAPVVAAVWARMGHRQPHASNKIAIGVVLGVPSFLLMVIPTSGHGGDAYEMAAWWIVGSYLLLGLGDVLLETSGMSATTKLAPRAFGSQTVMAMAPWLRRTMHPVR
ncbi:peptide MFS transporter [Streptomyces nojiriensis]|uniref:peptide MFS transporter n=1 Tax=Streptomyces nojiriensis TaxID=66374 RepID=UPI00365FAAF1